jgi:hypothetical protein
LRVEHEVSDECGKWVVFAGPREAHSEAADLSRKTSPGESCRMPEVQGETCDSVDASDLRMK